MKHAIKDVSSGEKDERNALKAKEHATEVSGRMHQLEIDMLIVKYSEPFQGDQSRAEASRRAHQAYIE